MASKMVAAAVYLATAHPLLCLGMGLVCCLLSAISFELLLAPRPARAASLKLRPALSKPAPAQRWRRAA